MQVYISHASQDRELASSLARAIRAADMLAWTPADILPGSNWASETGLALAQSDAMVVLFSRGSAHSPTLKQDVQYALTGGKYRGRVLPVLVDLPTFQAGADVPWVLLHLDSIHIDGNPPDFSSVISQLIKMSQANSSATA